MVMTASMPPVEIIIPTYDNYNQLRECLISIYFTRHMHPYNITIVNNGNPLQSDLAAEFPNVQVIEPGRNLGWTGGIIEGLKHTKNSRHVLFMNDDTLVPQSSARWLRDMVRLLCLSPGLAAVGPSSNCVMGSQNIWNFDAGTVLYTTFLIGFCMMVDRTSFESVGGLDPEFHTGDDIDLSMRLRDAGFKICVARNVFVYHHGFQTGSKIHGDHTKNGGWNSPQMTRETNERLIRKHGFKKWWNTMVKVSEEEIKSHVFSTEDKEGKLVRSCIEVEFENGIPVDEVLELGCGPTLTIPGSVGFDKVQTGEEGEFVKGECVNELVGDIENGIPEGKWSVVIARHVLEHLIDPLQVLQDIYHKLKDNGFIVIAVPDEQLGDTIYMNPEHLHAFTPNSLFSLMSAAGFRNIIIHSANNGISFVMKGVKK